MFYPGHARVKRKGRADRLVGRATVRKGLRLGNLSVEELEALDHYLRAQSQGLHTIDHLEEKVRLTKGKRSATVSERKEKTIEDQRHRQRWNCFLFLFVCLFCFKATLGKGPRDWAERILALPSA